MMEPGRELDVLIAEKVMGWKRLFSDESVRKIVETSGPISAGGINFLMNLQNSWIIPGEPSPEIIEVPQYSTDIAAAWAVVEHFRSKEWGEAHGYYDVWISAAGGTYPYQVAEKQEKKNTVEIFIDTGARHREIARGESDISMPHAICLAALEAVR